mmetsp:Transcript_37620/g.55098  ORF Transcript_37620/g.55098 Transcript_37620/m.55098 type:complete len:219 (+) Transcript_37620:98-754(+)
MSSKLLSSLCRANISILSQKVALIDALTINHGADKARVVFRSACPLIGASIGQHYRHSMDHIELAALVASTGTTEGINANNSENISTPPLHYDLRVRGGTLEHDMDESRKRILSVMDIFQDLELKQQTEESDVITNCPVVAHFYLSPSEDEKGGGSQEIGLTSTIGRELGFCAHHAIHHMAMVKIIALNFAGLSVDELPPDFGKAPSTIIYDRGNTSN